MNRVIIESPFAGDVERNLRYLRACMRDCVRARGETPYASHGLLTQPGVLDDSVLEERNLGIEAGYAMWPAMNIIAFYIDLGWSSGMMRAKMRYDHACALLIEAKLPMTLQYEERSLGPDWDKQ